MPPGTSPGGQLMGPQPSSYLQSLFPPHLSFSEDLVTITTVLRNPDGETSRHSYRVKSPEKISVRNQPAHSQPTQTHSHLGIFQFACNKLQEEAVASLMCWEGWNGNRAETVARSQREQRHIVLPLTSWRNGNNVRYLSLSHTQGHRQCLQTNRYASQLRVKSVPRLECLPTVKCKNTIHRSSICSI